MGYDYDGNITQDVKDPQTGNFIFNGDKKQAEVGDANNNLVGRYFYDGKSKGVKKQIYDPYGVEQ